MQDVKNGGFLLKLIDYFACALWKE